jgi:hypothetical protein
MASCRLSRNGDDSAGIFHYEVEVRSIASIRLQVPSAVGSTICCRIQGLKLGLSPSIRRGQRQRSAPLRTLPSKHQLIATSFNPQWSASSFQQRASALLSPCSPHRVCSPAHSPAEAGKDACVLFWDHVHVRVGPEWAKRLCLLAYLSCLSHRR